MKRYLLFCGVKYYPYGGWGDFVRSDDDLQELIVMGRERIKPKTRYYDDWWHIIDTTKMEMVDNSKLDEDKQRRESGKE